MSAKLFEAALSIAEPWYIQGVDFDAGKKTLTIGINFIAGCRFPVLRASRMSIRRTIP